MWFTLIRFQSCFIAVNGNKNLISKKFMTKKIPLKKIIETFPETICKHIMTWLFKKGRHARLNIDAAATLLLAKKTICVHSQLSSILKCVTFATCSRFLLTINYFQVVDVDWPLVSMRILKTKWSPRWLAGCTALNVGCRGAASLAWRGRGRWGIRPPPGVAHGLTCSPFLASRLPLLRSVVVRAAWGAGRRMEANERECDCRTRETRLTTQRGASTPPLSVRGTAAVGWMIWRRRRRTCRRVVRPLEDDLEVPYTTQGRIAKRRFERGSPPNTRG